jgi:hypothetical protein
MVEVYFAFRRAIPGVVGNSTIDWTDVVPVGWVDEYRESVKCRMVGWECISAVVFA